MIKPEGQTESSDGEMSGEYLGALLRQVSKNSIGEIDSPIVELKTLHKKLDRWRSDSTRHCATRRTEPAGNATDEDYLGQRETTPRTLWVAAEHLMKIRHSLSA